MILWDYPFLIDSNQHGDVKPESLVSQRPSLYEIGGVVSMHPTVLDCSPMKERDEAFREEAISVKVRIRSPTSFWM